MSDAMGRKVMMSLVPPGTATRIARVMQCAVTRPGGYGVHDWMDLSPRALFLDALERHLESIKIGEIDDPDDGLPHIDHVIANAAILAYFHGEGESILHPKGPLRHLRHLRNSGKPCHKPQAASRELVTLASTMGACDMPSSSVGTTDASCEMSAPSAPGTSGG